MVDHILVEAFSGKLLDEGTHQVEIEVAVFVSGAGLIVVVALFPVGVGGRIYYIQYKVPLAVIEAGGVGHQHLQGDYLFRILGVADGEAGQFAGIRIQSNQPLFNELHHGSGAERLGDGGDAEKIVFPKRSPELQI